MGKEEIDCKLHVWKAQACRLHTAKVCKNVPSKQSISTSSSVHEAHVVFLWCSNVCCSFPLQTDHDRQNFLLCSCVFRAFGRCATDSKSRDAHSESLRRATVLFLERRWLLEEILRQPLSQQLEAILGSSLSRGCQHYQHDITLTCWRHL